MNQRTICFILVGTSLACFALWMGFFFGLVFVQIRVNTVYATSTCNVTYNSLGVGSCCSTVCSGCSNVYGLAPSCSSVIASSPSPGNYPCTGGYYCCFESCQQCCSQHCTTSSCSTTCISCNCYCSSSVPNRACTVSCVQCYTPTATYQYYTSNGELEIYTESQSCGSNVACANQFVESRQINSSRTCYYDPNNFQSVTFEKGYTAGPFVALAFPSLYFVILLCFGVGFVIWKLFKKINCRKTKLVDLPPNYNEEELAGEFTPPSEKEVNDFLSPENATIMYTATNSDADQQSNPFSVPTAYY